MSFIYPPGQHTPVEDVLPNEPKPATDLLPALALLAVADVLAANAPGRDPRAYEHGRPMLDDFAALLRHLLRWRSGEDIDPVSGRRHLQCAAARALILLELDIRHPGMDNRKPSRSPAA